MRLLKRSIAMLLFMCMSFAFIPQQFLDSAFAEVISGISISSGAAGSSNNAGGIYSANTVGFRIMLNRSPENYLNGTQEQMDKVIDYYNNRWPSGHDYGTNTIFFAAPDMYDWLYNKGNKNIIDYPGTIGLYSPGGEFSFYDGDYKNLIIRGNTNSSFVSNSFKAQVLSDYDSGKIADMSAYGENNWYQYMPNATEALNVLSYIFAKNGETYDVGNRITKFIEEGSVNGIFSKDPSELTDRQKIEASAGYVGLLLCFYSVIASDSSSSNAKRISTAGYYETAINDYLLNRNIEDKPVTLIIDTAASMVNNDDHYSYLTPTIDMLQYIGLNSESQALTNPDNGLVYDKYKDKTANLIKKMYTYSHETISFGELYTGTGDVGKPVRFMDYPIGSMSTASNHPIIWAYRAFFLNDSVNPQGGVVRNYESTGPNFAYANTGSKKMGYLTALTFDKEKDLYGFIIVGNHFSNPVPEARYYVDSTMAVLPNNCQTEIRLDTPPTINIYITGDSSLISSLNSRRNNEDFAGLIIKSSVSRKEYHNDFTSNPVEEIKNLTLLENQINRTLTGDELISVLEGNPIKVVDSTLIGADGKIYDKSPNGQTSVRFVYDINLDIQLDKHVYHFGTTGADGVKRTEFVMTSTDGKVKYNTAEVMIPMYSENIPTPDDIVITKPSSTNTTEVINPSENENLEENNQMIKKFTYSTEGADFAEIKNNEPLKEEYEVMAGIPSTEELYFSVGGSEYQVALVVQYWMNEHSRDRTYTVHFDGNLCEYNNQEKGKGDSWEGIDLPIAEGAISQTAYRFEHATDSDEEKTYGYTTKLSNPKTHYGPLTVTAKWTGTIKNNATAVSESQTTGCNETVIVNPKCPAQVDNTDYLNAVNAANKWMNDMANLSLSWTSASDKITRTVKLEKMNIGTGGASTTQADSADESYSFSYDVEGRIGLATGSYHYKFNNPADTEGYDEKASNCTFGENESHNHKTASATANPDSEKPYEIEVTFTILPHVICGPCCGHVMPDLWDTWRQGLVFDFAKISQLRLYKLDQGSVSGLKELVGVETVFANVMTGNPSYFMNIAQMTEKKRYKSNILPIPFDKNAAVEEKGNTNLTKSNLENNFITYIGSGDGLHLRHPAQSSRAGRLRYTLANGQNSIPILVTEQGVGSSYNFDFDPNKIAAPAQHDDVIYDAGKRSMNCDGMATTNTFGKKSINNVKPMEMTGHLNSWADGCLYTNILDKTVQSDIPYMITNSNAYSGYWDNRTYIDLHFENKLKTIDLENDANIMLFKEDYNHHIMRSDKLSDSTVSEGGIKKAYNDAADSKDMLTAEWKFFDTARRTKVVAHVISDFLILQTSGGDQSIMYYEKATDPTEAQEHFQKVKITAEELFYNNPLSIFTGDLSCQTGNAEKPQYTPDFIVVGGYNGQYNKPNDKYRPYSLQDGQFKKFYKEGWTIYDATSYDGKAGIDLTNAAYYNTTGFLGNTEIKTLLDTDPAGTIYRPTRQAVDQDSSFKIYQKDIQILPTAENMLYTPYDGRAFYSQVIGYYNIDRDGLDALDGSSVIKTIGNVKIGVAQYEKFGAYYKDYWGTVNGVDYETKYYMTPITVGGVMLSNTNSGGTTVNPIVVYTPVSTEDAIVMALDDISLVDTKGVIKTVSRDQRVNNFDYPNMNERVNALKVCPLDPELCEYRFLDCKFHEDKVVAEFDFETTYKEQIVRRVKQSDGTYKTVIEYGDTKNNTYKLGSNYITTNKVTGIEYTLPSGFTVNNGTTVTSSNSNYLSANGVRWAIPLSTLGISTSKSNVVEVEMDLTVNSTANNLMLVSFYNYGFLLTPSSPLGSFVGKSSLDNTQFGPKMDTKISKSLSKAHVVLRFSFNNIVDCSATVNGVEANVTISDLRKYWKDDSNGVRTLVTDRYTVTDKTNDAPSNFSTADIGSNLIIGDWGSDVNATTISNSQYKANYYIDNLKITLKGGSPEHNSTCYERITTHQTTRTHIHDDTCKLKEDVYICDWEPNYYGSPTCGLEQGEGGTDRILYVFKHLSGCTYSGKIHYSTSSTQCSCDHGTSSSCIGTYIRTETLPAGQCVWLHNNNADMHISDSTERCTFPGCTTPTTGSVTVDKSGHQHIGTPSNEANGCYTQPSEHIHNHSILICGEEESNNNIDREFTQSSSSQSIYLQKGKYLLEVWGGQGGSGIWTASDDRNGSFYEGGKGGYSKGIIELDNPTTLYVTVGGKGNGALSTDYNNVGTVVTGGYNGGGNGMYNKFDAYSMSVKQLGGGGGGATHIATKTGLLKNLSTSLDSIIIVAGGGGGAGSGRGGHAETTGTVKDTWNSVDAAGGAQSFYENKGIDARTLYSSSLVYKSSTHNQSKTLVSATSGTFGQGGQAAKSSGYVETTSKNLISWHSTQAGAGGGGYYGGGGGGAGYLSAGATGDDPSDSYLGGDGGGGSGYISSVLKDAVMYSGSSSYGNVGNGHAHITSLDHKHTSACYKNYNCDVLPKNSLVCSGVLNATTDFNTHVHTASCLSVDTEIDTRMFKYTGSVQTYTVPYTGDYAIESIGKKGLDGKTAAVRSTVSLVAGQVLYIYVAGNVNDYTDIRLKAKVDSKSGLGEGVTQDSLNEDSDNSRIISTGSTITNKKYTFAQSVGSTKVSNVKSAVQMALTDGNGRVVIRSLISNEDILTKIINGTFNKTQMQKYLGTNLGADVYSTSSSSRRSLIEKRFNEIPNIVDGDYNPIWKCKFKELNSHICENTNAYGQIIPLCTTYVLFNCTEPHHKGEHYSGTNRICWSACGDDSKHVNTKSEVTTNNGDTIRLSDYVQLDAGFTVYFPNIGHFRGNDALGLAQPQITRGAGYRDYMDTTQWTREKRVKFPFEVIFDDKKNGVMQIHKRNTWIELDVPTEYFNFYVLSTNAEMSNVKVEFEVEAINCGTSSGLQIKKLANTNTYLSYNSNGSITSTGVPNLDSTYNNALSGFRTGYLTALYNAINAGYKVSYPKNITTNSTTSSTSYGDFGFMDFYLKKSVGIENTLRNSMSTTDSNIEKLFEGTSIDKTGKDKTDYIWPHREDNINSINYRLKPITSNDNKVRVDNRMRTNSLESLHGGYKSFYLDVIGRIGNFSITDTEDYRFSNFFKMPISQVNSGVNLLDANNWLVEGLVEKVDDSIQNYYIGDTYDLRGNKASSDTRWLDTYNTETWMSGVLDTELNRNLNKANLVSQILTGEVNNIEVLQKEQLRYGYDVFTSIVTLGSYTGGYVQVIPKWYALKLSNNVGNPSYDKTRGTFIPLDVYINRDGLYTPVNIFGNAENGEPNRNNLRLHDYSFNLDWTTENGRRNYTMEEKTRTLKIKAYLANYDFGDIPNIDEIIDLENGKGIEELQSILDSIDPKLIELDTPIGKNNYMGTSQYMLLDGKHRTFIGSSTSYNGKSESTADKYLKNGLNSKYTTYWGIDKNKGKVLKDVDFEKAVQRWHGKLGVPSSAVFVPTGEPVNTDTINYIMNDEWALICTAEIIAIGDVWSIAYTQPWFTSLEINHQYYDIASNEHYPGHRIYKGKDSVQCPECIPPIIAVYSSSKSSVNDVEVVQTH